MRLAERWCLRIPVPDPGVPALPEMDTSTPSPSSWSSNGPSLQVLAIFISPSPFQTQKLAGHHFINRFKKTGKNSTEKIQKEDS
ncbi:hypothetical protein ACLKA6_015925 [Drosophila palustris]